MGDLFSAFFAFIYILIPAVIIIWFMVNVVSSLREQNGLLKEVIRKLDELNKDTNSAETVLKKDE